MRLGLLALRLGVGLAASRPPRVARTRPEELDRVESPFPGMQVHLVEARSGGVLYVLCWETPGPNGDRPREGALPSAGVLRM